MVEHEPLISDLHEGHRRFLELVDSVRPELHRYCAHNRALDFLRRYDRRMAEPLADDIAAVVRPLGH